MGGDSFSAKLIFFCEWCALSQLANKKKAHLKETHPPLYSHFNPMTTQEGDPHEGGDTDIELEIATPPVEIVYDDRTPVETHIHPKQAQQIVMDVPPVIIDDNQNPSLPSWIGDNNYFKLFLRYVTLVALIVDIFNLILTATLLDSFIILAETIPIWFFYGVWGVIGNCQSKIQIGAKMIYLVWEAMTTWGWLHIAIAFWYLSGQNWDDYTGLSDELIALGFTMFFGFICHLLSIYQDNDSRKYKWRI